MNICQIHIPGSLTALIWHPNPHQPNERQSHNCTPDITQAADKRASCALQETRQQARNGEGGLLALAASVAGCILECFYTLIEYLTKFATVMMSITGEVPATE